LTNEIAAGLVEPVQHFDPLEILDTVEGGDPGLADLDAADRAVFAPAMRTVPRRGPGCPDDADEHEARRARFGRLDRDFIPPPLARGHHASPPEKIPKAFVILPAPRYR